jgi:hypothetical protein
MAHLAVFSSQSLAWQDAIKECKAVIASLNHSLIEREKTEREKERSQCSECSEMQEHFRSADQGARTTMAVKMEEASHPRPGDTIRCCRLQLLAARRLAY